MKLSFKFAFKSLMWVSCFCSTLQHRFRELGRAHPAFRGSPGSLCFMIAVRDLLERTTFLDVVRAAFRRPDRDGGRSL